jgi:hypothetical protein
MRDVAAQDGQDFERLDFLLVCSGDFFGRAFRQRAI